MKTLIFLFFVNFPTGILEDRNQDGVIDYVNARVYVADDPTPEELAAAANVAARLAFESLSIDLPIGYTISDYSNGDSSVAIVVGRAAIRFLDGQSEPVVETTAGRLSALRREGLPALRGHPDPGTLLHSGRISLHAGRDGRGGQRL